MQAIIGALVALTLWIGNAQAQHQNGSGYAAMSARSVKALSDEQVVQLKEGRGMGLSLPAELNGYPGPLHVLELADVLNLTVDQRDRITAIKQQMSTEAVALGHQIIAAEGLLDRAFAFAKAERAEVIRQLSEIGRLNGELRSVHILAHMETRALLTPNQVARYDTERGYSGLPSQSRQRQHSGGHLPQH